MAGTTPQTLETLHGDCSGGSQAPLCRRPTPAHGGCKNGNVCKSRNITECSGGEQHDWVGTSKTIRASSLVNTGARSVSTWIFKRGYCKRGTSYAASLTQTKVRQYNNKTWAGWCMSTEALMLKYLKKLRAGVLGQILRPGSDCCLNCHNNLKE